jgi:hypothetical protein
MAKKSVLPHFPNPTLYFQTCLMRTPPKPHLHSPFTLSTTSPPSPKPHIHSHFTLPKPSLPKTIFILLSHLLSPTPSPKPIVILLSRCLPPSPPPHPQNPIFNLLSHCLMLSLVLRPTTAPQAMEMKRRERNRRPLELVINNTEQ